LGEINWETIKGEGGFFDPKLLEISGYGRPCLTCGHQPEKKKVRTLKEKLFTEFAKQVAEESRNNGLTNNQLRNFYDVIKATQDKLMQAPTEERREGRFQVEKRRLNLLFSKVAYARKGRGKNIPEEFATFMKECLEIVTKSEAKYEDFKAFVMTFEAVAGYFGTEKKGKE